MSSPNIQLPKYDVFRNWINSRRARGIEWDSIMIALKSTRKDFEEYFPFFSEAIDPDTDLDINAWELLVKSEMESEARSLELQSIADSAIIFDPHIQDEDVHIPKNPNSSWQLYKNHLTDSGWKKESIDEVESATIGTLKRLSRNTSVSGSVKGLVVGHVQSGKTANMAALMAMAGDWGWNLFIVLSGTIENLRRQTQNRLNNDLNRPGTINWIGLEHLSKYSPIGQRAQDLQFEDTSHLRYFTVCLKNSTRLKNLIDWVISDQNKCKQMKIIIIDDESDQAGVNTADINREERAKINSLIVNLVEGKRSNGKDPGYRPLAMNYIGYTATPYANFLNESSTESLYPMHFIRTLKPSNEYFGPKQIFGLEEDVDCDGLNVIRKVTKEDLHLIAELHADKSNLLPESLQNSLIWFLCSAAAMRFQGHKKPISMLIHTSQKQVHHQLLADALSEWLVNKDLILSLCNELWDYESNQLTVESFREKFPLYGRDNDEINLYPSFHDIKDGILTLLRKLSHIQMDSDGALTYHDGIHLCIDNCANNGINDDGMVVRLVYPEQRSDNYPSPAPAFIVIGGNTLSRGLTIEGLVSTYFLRASNQADSLMQMGRWFGYRKGYELYQRIWMTDVCLDKFRFLTRLEQDLRDDLRRFMEAGESPAVYGPRVRNSPKISWLRITSKNKMQGAVSDEMDFTGTSSQTVVFDNDREILKGNIDTTDAFLKSLGAGRKSDFGNSIVWDNVDFDKIRNLLFSKFTFSQSGRVFNQIDVLCDWIASSSIDAGFTGWSVVAAGVKLGDNAAVEDVWKLPGGAVGKVNRSKQKNQKSEIISIVVLRAPKDLVADVRFEVLSENTKEKIKSISSSLILEKIRAEAGLDKTPQLILYRIKKNSKFNPSSSEDLDDGSVLREKQYDREDLDAPEDIIGLSIMIPGTRSSTSCVRMLTVNIQKENIYIDSEVTET